MARIKRKDVNEQLLDAIFTLEKDWKYIQKIGAQSIERTPYSRSVESLARARYLYLLKEARHRKMNALNS